MSPSGSKAGDHYSFTHSFIPHSITRLLPPPLPITGGSTLPRLRAPRASFLMPESFSYHPLPPHPNCILLVSTSKYISSFTLSPPPWLPASSKPVIRPTFLAHRSSSAPLVFPLAHTASKISESKMQIRYSPSPALDRCKIPILLKAKAKVFSEAYVIWPAA